MKLYAVMMPERIITALHERSKAMQTTVSEQIRNALIKHLELDK